LRIPDNRRSSSPEIGELNSSRSSFLLSNPEPGFGYFETQAHYHSLAGRILTALGGFDLVVVTGDRPSAGPMVCSALSQAVAGRYTVIGLPFEPKLSGQDVLWPQSALSASLHVASSADQDLEVPALIVFYDIDQYSDKHIVEILSHVHGRTRIGDHRITAAVFLGRAEFLARLEQPLLRAWLAKRLLVARLVP
jgi:hypothetical protein